MNIGRFLILLALLCVLGAQSFAAGRDLSSAAAGEATPPADFLLAETFLDSVNPVPGVSSVSPTSACAGDTGLTLTVNGSNFVAGSLVRWDGLYLTTTYVDTNLLTASVTASELDTAGSFSVTVFNPAPGGGTSNAQTFTVNAVLLSTTQVNVACNGGSTGSINLTAAGGTSPYTYSWTDGPTAEDRSGLAAGTYTVTVTDVNGCTASTSVTITEPPALSLSETHTNVACNGGLTGSIDLTVTGGTAPYTYSWNDGPATQDRSGLAAGSYTVTVTDANGCTDTASVTITEPPALSLTETHLDVACNGGLTGSIDLTVTGGTAPYTYSWSDGPTTQDRAGLAAGTYMVTVTDANACTDTIGVTLTQPPALVLGTTQVNPACNGDATGSVDLTVAGGTPPYTYSWSDGPTTQDRTGLAAGTYTVTVSDSLGCTAQTSATITQPPALLLSTTQVNVACSGGSTGSIDLTVAGGTSPYTYSWSDGPATEDRSGLAAGTYTVTATDANGCTDSTSVTITQSGTLLLSESHVNVACNGGSTGSIDLTVAGGTPPYTYSWSDGPATQDRSGLPAGSYTVTVTDSNGCTAQTSATITEPAALVLTETHTDTICNGATNGTIDLTAAGGTAPYTYSWNDGPTTEDRTGLPAGTYTVTVTDANGCSSFTSATITQPAAIVLGTTQVNVACNGGSTGSVDLTVSGGIAPYSYSWNDGPATEDRSGLAAGTYTVTVTDIMGCTSQTSVTITEPAALSLSETHVNVACSGGSTGSIDLTVAGGTAPYAYSWADGPTTQDRTGLAAGTYTVTVTDANGCTDTASVTINQAGDLQLSESHVNVACNGGLTGSVDLTVTGGTPPYAYSWSDGPTTQDRTGLAAGSYTVTVTDSNGCSNQTGVTITEPAALVLAETHTDTICNGSATGTIDLTAAGGTPPYTYSWNDGPTSEDRTGLPAGSYSVTVTDGNGCTASTNVAIAQAAALVLGTTQVNVACNGGLTGSADLTVTGGTAPYTYSWNDGPTTEDRAGLSAGTYTVTVTDNMGCTAQTSVTIAEPPALSLGETHVNVACNGGSTGTIDLTVTGGTAPYAYSWADGPTTQDRTGLAAGTYTVTVTDANGCVASTGVTITEPAALALGTTQVNVACNGGSTGSIDVTVAGGTAPYTASWTDGPATEDRSGLAAGTYTVTVTDANGCTDSASVTITQPPALVIGTTQINVACNGASTGAIDLSVAGGTPPYTYSWGDGPATQDRSGLAAGTYTVTVTDSNGCTALTGATITQPPALVLSTTQVNVACNGGSTGSIDLTVAGGVLPYTYSWADGPATEDRSGLAAGTYTVTVTDSNGCTSQTSVTINQSGTLAISETHVNVACNGGSTGSIDAAVTGGTPPYTYSWNDGPATQDRTGLPAGTYTLTVTDSNGCSSSKVVTITEPAVLSATQTRVDVACNGGTTGSIDVTVTGGTAPYTYSWNDGPTTQDRTGLAAGTYTVTVTDANGCTDTAGATITQPAVLAVGETHVNVVCNGGTNGSIDITVTGGTAPYTYNWGGGVTAEDRTGLPAGTYTVTVTDSRGCSALKSVTITQPAAFTVTESHVNVLCNGGSNGSIDITVAGGVPPYAYSWTSGPTTQDVTGLTAGSYTVVIVDANGCATTKSVTITQPAAIVISPATLPDAVLGSSYSQMVSATGGTLPYRFSSSGSLPPGLSLSVGGLLAGIPSLTGTFTFTVIDSDAHDCAGTRVYSLKVRKKPTISSLGQSVGITNIGDTVTFTDTVRGSVPDGGTVQFRDGLADIGIPVPIDVNGVASISTADLSTGAHAITAFYSGTLLYDSSTSNAVTHIVAYNDTNWYRSATSEQWALGRDTKGAIKPVKRKAVGVSFELVFRAPDTADGFTMQLNMIGSAVVLRNGTDTLTPIVPWVNLGMAEYVLPVVRFESFTVIGQGSAGTPAKLKVTWRTGRNTSRTYQPSEFRVNRLALPLPNLHNVGEELLPNGSSYRSPVFPQGVSAGISGALFGPKLVGLGKYRDIQTSLVKKTSAYYILHTGGPRCLDVFDNGSPITRVQRTLPPTKQSNMLFAELVALKLNIGASVAHRFPNGFGELTYYDALDPSDPFNALMVKDIAAMADTVLACGILSGPFAQVTAQRIYDAVRRINESFASPVIDTVSFATQTWLKGAWSIGQVPFLHKTQGIVPLSIFVDGVVEDVPAGYSLQQNFPNPFNPTTTISFELELSSLVTLKVFNMLGQEVAVLHDNEELAPGLQEIDFDASGLSSGIYFYRLEVRQYVDNGAEEVLSDLTTTQTKKMLLLR